MRCRGDMGAQVSGRSLPQRCWGSGQGSSPGLPHGLQHAPIRVKGNYVEGMNSRTVHP